MTPILYESDEKEFWSKGLGPLSDAEKCTVTEERNGAYTLSMTYPINGAQADKIANNRIIKADNAYDLKNQLFVIKTVTPIMTETGEISLSVYAEHISYITNDLSIPPELSLTGTAQQALDQWKDSLIGGDTSGITVDSDVTNTSSTLLTIQNVANARQALGGVEGSILYNWKGEYRFDNLHISLKKQRGTTANTLLSYGRNLLTFEQEQNIAETYTTLYPYALVTAAGGMIQKLVTIDGYLVDSKYVSHYPNRKIKTHDFTSDFQNYRVGAKPSENAEEGVTYADLATIKKYLKDKALHFMTTNDIGVPKISTTITFADLSKTDDELAKFEKLSLCDKVPVHFEKLGINSTIKVTRTVWNVLTDSYDSIELGDLNMTIGETVASVSAETSAIKTKVNQASVTAQIAADGTHNIFRTDDETEPIAKKVGDLWYKTDGKYTSMYQWDGKAWVLIVNTRDTADVRAELDQAKVDMEQAKTDAQNAYDEAIKATGTANGAKAQTAEALEQAKQANDSYTALAKEVADDKASVDADYQKAQAAVAQARADAQTAYDEAIKATNTANGAKAQTAEALERAKQANDSYTALAKEVADDKASVDADYQKAQTDIAQARADAQTAYDEAIKATDTANGAKAQTVEALEQARQANDSYTALAKEVADNKASVDTDITDVRKTIDANKASADADWEQAQEDYASVSDKLTETSKTVTDIKTSVNGIKTTVADNAGKISTMSQTVDGVKTSVANAQGDIATLQTDVSGTKQTVANAQKDITSIKTSVSGVQTDITNAKKDITSVKTDISGVKTSVANAQGDVTSLKISVSGVQADVKNAKGDITTLQTDVSGVKTTVADNTGKITQLTTDVNGVKSSVSNKVDKTVYQSYVTQTDKALSTKLTASDLNGYAKIADVKQTTDGLSASITKVQGNLAYQASELIGKKSFEDGDVGAWTCNDLTTKAEIMSYRAYGYTRCIYTPNNNDLYWNIDCKVNPGDKYYVELLVPNPSATHSGRTITAKALFRYTKDGASAWQLGPSGQVPNGNSAWIKGIITVPDGVTSVKPCISVIDNGANGTVYLTYASFVKLDDYTQSQLNTLSGKITATSERLSSVYTKSETDAKLGTKVEQSVLTQTSNNLSASIAGNTDKITKLTADVNGVKTTIADNTGKISTISQTVNGVKTTVADHTGKITQLTTDVNGVKTTVGDVQGNVTTLQADAKSIKTTVSDHTGKISTMQTDVNGVKANVKNAQGDISSLQTDVSGVKTTVADHSGKITQLTTDVNGVKSTVSSKVDKTVYQSYVTQTDKALSTKLTASDLTGYAKIADVKQTTDGLSASITKVQGNLAYQASELIGKKSFEDGDVGAWTCNDLTTKAEIMSYRAYGYTRCICTPNNNDLYWNIDCKVNPGDKYYVELLVPNPSATHSGRTITAKALFRYTKDGSTAWQVGPTGQVPGGNTVWIKGIITVPDGVTSIKPCISVIDNGANGAVYLTYASFVKLDEYTQSQLNTLSGKITATSDRLSSVYTKSEVDGKLGTKVEQSALTQTSNNLSASIVENSKALASNTSKITQLTADVNGVKSTVADNTGEISTMSQTVNGIKTTVSSNTGKITQLTTDVTGVKTTVGDVQGNVATLQADAKSIKATVSDHTGKISTMQTDINGVKTNVKNAQGDITTLQTDVSGIKTTVSDHTGKITQLTTDITGVKSSVSSKVDKTTYQSYVTQTDKALSTKLTESDLQGYAKTTDIKQTTDELSASITKVQGNLAYQASELIGKKSFEDGDVGAWTCNDLTTKAEIMSYRAYGYTRCIYTPNNNDLYWNIDCKVNPGDKYYVELLVPNPSATHSGRTITVKALFRYTKDGSTAWQVGPTGQVPDGNSAWIKGIITVPDGVTSVKPCISVTDNGVNSVVHLTYASFVKLDDYTQSQLTTLSGKITATSDRLSSVYTKSEVDGKLGTKVEQSTLTQTSNNLSASIAKNSKILSSIGLTSDTAYINANKIALNGKTLMSNAVINDAFIGNMSADKITTGTLNAANVNLINVNASNISTGVLNGIKITSTGKDPSGTSSTTTIQSGYIDTNVINCSDYIMVGKADADPRKRWQTKQDSFGMWFQTPAKLSGHTGNAPSDWQSEWQGFIGGDGWNYKSTTVSGTGFSGIKLVLTPQQEWGRPYGGDQWSIGNWVKTEASNKSGDIKDGALDPVMWYSYTGFGAAYADQLVVQKKTQFFDKVNFQGGVRIGVTGASHGIRTAWVSWSDWGSNQKIPCIVQDADNWGGIAFPANGRVVLFTRDYRINTDGLPRNGGSYNGYGG